MADLTKIVVKGCTLFALFFVWTFVVPTQTSAKDSVEKPAKKIVLQLRWRHQFQFAGYYAAKEKGLYQKAGLDVEIREGGFKVNTIDEVVEGRAQFGVTNSEILISRLKENKKVVAVASIFQHSPLVFLARKDTLIHTPQDLIGKRVKMTRQIRDLELHATLFKEGVRFEQFELLDGPMTKDMMFDPSIHAIAVYITNEPYHYIKRKIPYNVIRPSAYGVDFYGDLIFAQEKWAHKNAETVEAFRSASIRGWQYAMAHKPEIIELIHTRYNPKKELDHLVYEADTMDKLILQDIIEIGHTNPGRWESIAKIFAENGVIDPDYTLKGLIFTTEKERDIYFWVSIGVLLAIIVLILSVAIVLFNFNSRLNREIKAKEKSQSDLVESESRLKAMFENIHSGVAIYEAVDNGRNFVIKSFNRAAQKIEKVKLQDVIGKPVTEVFPGVRDFGLFDAFQRVYRSGHPEHMPVSLYKDNRIVGWRENYIYKLPSGELAAVYNDETVRKKAEIHRKHLDTINHIIINTRHSDQMLQLILNAMLDIFDSDRVFLLYPCDPASDYYIVKVESAKPDWPGLGASDTRHPCDEFMAQTMAALLKTNGPVNTDIAKMADRPPGNTAHKYHIKHDMRMAIYPKIDKPWMLGMHRCSNDTAWSSEERLLFNTIGRRISDGLNAMLLIGELKRANEILAESEDRFAKVFHASPVGIIIADKKQLDILNTNESLCSHLGFRKDELIGRSLMEPQFLISEQSQNVVEEMMNEASGNNLDVGLITKNNEARDGRLSFQSVDIDGRHSTIITVEDVTEYKKAQQEKLMAHRHAAEQEKYALIGQVAGKMAHDFNNILGAIMGNTELSLLECREPETLKTLKLILEQTKRGRNLTKNLVVFAKDQEPRQDFFSINEKAALVLNLLKKDLEGITISTSFFEPMPQLLADPGMIENALVNIIQNAIHAVSKESRPKLEIRTFKETENIIISVRDNGCGIPKSHERSIYAPAFTLKNSNDTDSPYDTSIKGTGYGLFNVKKIVEKHKGRVWFESRENEGTCFYLSIPIIKKDLTRKEKQELTRSVVHTGKKILIVEDEQPIAQVQYYILTSDPFFHQVDIAHNGHMAMDLLERNTYDLISLDYRLPGGLNGMDIYQAARQKGLYMPILFISGNVEFLESLAPLIKVDKNLSYLSKPTQNKEYVDAVNSMFNE